MRSRVGLGSAGSSLLEGSKLPDYLGKPNDVRGSRGLVFQCQVALIGSQFQGGGLGSHWLSELSDLLP